MIDAEKLLKSSHITVSISKIEIDKDFVREFREKNSLSSTALAAIFGVTKKTVEKWEKGERKVKGSDAVLFKVLNDNPEILSQLYTVKIIPGFFKKEKEIPKKYMFRGSYEEGGFRTPSSIGEEIEKKKLEEIECPFCGKKELEIKNYGYDNIMGEYIVECDHCSWQNPMGTISDYGEAPCEFKFWLEAFYLMGKPKAKVNEDLTLYFYPDDGWKEKKKKEREKEKEKKRGEDE